MTAEDYRILYNGKKYKVQRRYYTLLRRREVWQDETETYYTGIADCDWSSVTTARLFDTYDQALAFVQAQVKRDAPEIWHVIARKALVFPNDPKTCSHKKPDGSNAVEGHFFCNICSLCGKDDLGL